MCQQVVLQLSSRELLRPRVMNKSCHCWWWINGHQMDKSNATELPDKKIFWYFLLLASVPHWSLLVFWQWCKLEVVLSSFFYIIQTGLINSLHLYFSQHQMSSSVFTVGKLLNFLSPYKLLNYWRFSSIERLNDTIAWTLGIYQILENVISSLSEDSRPSVWFIKCKQQQMCSDWSVWGC